MVCGPHQDHAKEAGRYLYFGGCEAIDLFGFIRERFQRPETNVVWQVRNNRNPSVTKFIISSNRTCFSQHVPLCFALVCLALAWDATCLPNAASFSIIQLVLRESNSFRTGSVVRTNTHCLDVTLKAGYINCDISHMGVAV